MENNLKNKIYFKNIAIAVSFFVIGVLLSNFVILKNKHTSKDADLSLFWDVWQAMEEYYPFDEPGNEDKVYSAIEGLVESYDDEYSSFFPPARSEFFSQTISGTFAGIGAEIGIRNGYLSVIAPLKDSPAEKAGIKSGDIVSHVDGIDISGDTLDVAIARIRGPIRTDVILTIIRIEEGELETVDITINRDTVNIPVLEIEQINDVFIIHLYNFNTSAKEEFTNALTEFKNSGSTKLLIDVRNNPGGFLSASIDMASYFLPQGSVILREKFGEGKEDKIYRSKGYLLLEDLDFQTIVLQNSGSASASEILAGALRDNNAAFVAGEQSYGKGSVQQLIDLPENTALKVTIAKWLTPSSNQISEIGITPDFEISSDYDSIEDIQLQETLKLFN